VAAADSNQIVIRRIKKVSGGHHGGAWKVAFADFVTAMMAFFMVMWLVGAASTKEKAAISQYFNDPTGGGPQLTTHGGIGPGGLSSSMISTAGPMEPQKNDDTGTNKDAQAAAEAQEKAQLEALREELEEAISKSQALAPFKDQLLIDITDEGLRIQIVDKMSRPMFDSGSSSLKPYAADILHELAPYIEHVENGISISGHTDDTPFLRQDGYSNWELSTDRANAARRALVNAGLEEAKLVKVVGLSASVPFLRDDPGNEINRRISIIVMNRKSEDAVRNGGATAPGESTETPTAEAAPPAVEGAAPPAHIGPTSVGPTAQSFAAQQTHSTSDAQMIDGMRNAVAGQAQLHLSGGETPVDTETAPN